MALNKLSARKVETLSKPGWYNDGGGLYLRITEGRPTKWVLYLQTRHEAP